ncbi:pyridoxine/pyridoxamine 5'-phosphate oxidase isoform X1 [Diabrotica virgifera virgifera]|uniref:pyridoxal 5'-phosphate synthase n=1 Tax=Diabrotica virgifera virgifera TaxID=50390 RepID=A0A6P7FIR0_DIAVI|nr:pyridoxine/pyridoxamine 5'-phosphate oxidase isoform X1 [Diabrotica virgifera virgifera]
MSFGNKTSFIGYLSIKRLLNMEESSGLSFINLKDSTSPFELVAEWFQEAGKCGVNMHFFNLATSTKSGEVSNRSLLLHDYVNNSFRFITNEKSLKGRDMDENPNVAACFLLQYLKDDKSHVVRQIRCQGSVIKLPYKETAKYYEKDPLFCQIRSQIVPKQGEKVDWNELKIKHDELLKNVKSGLKLRMPEYQVGYEIHPRCFDFYHSLGGEIADRIIFEKSSDGSWSSHHVAC